MIRHGTIDWLTLYLWLMAAIMLGSGATWCVSPKSFVKAYRALIFRDKITTLKWWESAVYSKSGRVGGAMIACFGGFILYCLLSGEYR